MANSSCMDEGTATLVIGIFNCVADLLTTMLPIPLIMRLRMPLKHRIEVCVLLGLGLVVTIAGVIRTYFIWKSLIDSYDTTWFSYPLWIAAAIEIDVAVVSPQSSPTRFDSANDLMCRFVPALPPSNVSPLHHFSYCQQADLSLPALIHRPIARITNVISSKISSLRSPTSSRRTQNSSSTASGPQNHFRMRQQNDSVWDGDSSHGMLRLERDCEKDRIEAVHLNDFGNDVDSRSGSSLGGIWTGRRPAPASRLPTLEIIKSQSVDQEISYVDPERNRVGSSPLAYGGNLGFR